MRRIFALVFGFGLGLVVMFLAFNVHVVRTDSNWHFVKKQKVQFADITEGDAKFPKTAADGWVWHAWEQSPGGTWSGWAPLWPGAAGSGRHCRRPPS